MPLTDYMAIYNPAMTGAEVAFTFPNKAIGAMFMARTTGAQLRITSGTTEYMSLIAGITYTLDMPEFERSTIYLTGTAPNRVEIIVWLRA